MQQVAPEVLDYSDESAATLSMYGVDNPKTRSYGERCLLARRLCEAGVRFVQVNYGDNSANPAWDQHSNLPKHADHAAAVDQPIAGLMQDLKQRGLLDDTIVWWGSEFGHTLRTGKWHRTRSQSRRLYGVVSRRRLQGRVLPWRNR